jgi:hypothetical protein
VLGPQQNPESVVYDSSVSDCIRRSMTGVERYNFQKGGANMARHPHKFTIADDDAVQALVGKLTDGGRHQQRREKLLHALDDAIRHYKDSNQKVRQAFFHGLLTGYAVALKLW